MNYIISLVGIFVIVSGGLFLLFLIFACLIGGFRAFKVTGSYEYDYREDSLVVRSELNALRTRISDLELKIKNELERKQN